MNSSNSRRVVNMAIFGLVGVGLIGITSPANAAAPVTGTATQQCLVKPAWWNTTTEAAQSHVEQRWYRDLLGQEKITYDAHKFGYSFAEQKEESHAEWKYSNFVEGLEEIAHYLHQFERTNPGQAEVSHYLHQFERINPGQEATSSLSYQFSRTNPGQAEKSHQEYKYTKQAPAVLETKYKKSVVKTEFEYKKYVKGVVQVKQGHQWVSAGSTFTWEIWPNYPAKWDVSNKDVIESGGHNSVLAEWTEGGKQYRKVTTEYQYQNTGETRLVNTGQFTYEWFASDPGSPWVSTGTTRELTPATTLYYNDGNWTTDINPEGWTKVDEKKVTDQVAIDPFTEYRAQDGSATTDVNNAGTFEESSFEGWTQFGEPKVVPGQVKIDPFTEYRAQDGSATTDVNNAGSFKDSSFEGWTLYGVPEKVTEQVAIDPFQEYLAQDGSVTTDPLNAGSFKDAAFEGWTEFGEPEKVIEQHATEDQTNYLTRDAEGNLGSSTNKADASTFTSSDGVDLTTWNEFDREIVIDQIAVEGREVYLTMDDQGNLGYTEILADATWFPIGFQWPVISDPGSIWEEMVKEQGDPLFDPTTDLSLWGLVVNADGSIMTRTFTLQEEIPEQTVYYSPDGPPTTELGESNWTTDTPVDWAFLDKRSVEDKAASSSSTLVPAAYELCAVPVVPAKTTPVKAAPAKTPTTGLAHTGADGTTAAIAGAAALLAAGGAALVISRRRNKHAEDSTDTTQVS